MRTPLIPLTTIAAALALTTAGCGSSKTASPTAAPKSAATPAAGHAASGSTQPATPQPGGTGPAAPGKTTPAAPTKQSVTDRVSDVMNYHKGVLKIEQLATHEDDRSRFDIRVSRKVFCALPASQRLPAVRDVFAKTAAAAKAGGVAHPRVHVSRLTDTGDIVDVYARSRGDSIALTNLGTSCK